MTLQQEAMQLALDYGRRVYLTPEKLIEFAKSILEFLNTPIQYRDEVNYASSVSGQGQGVGFDIISEGRPIGTTSSRPRR